MLWLERVSQFLNKVLTFIAGLALAAMILITCGNIILREVWLPIRGTFELLGLFGAVAAAFALGYTQKYRMHIAVTILVDKFSSRTRRLLTVVNNLMCMIFFGLAAWQITSWSLVLIQAGELTETLRMPFYPFTLATALGCGVLALIFLTETLRIFFPPAEAES